MIITRVVLRVCQLRHRRSHMRGSACIHIPIRTIRVVHGTTYSEGLSQVCRLRRTVPATRTLISKMAFLTTNLTARNKGTTATRTTIVATVTIATISTTGTTTNIVATSLRVGGRLIPNIGRTRLVTSIE